MKTLTPYLMFTGKCREAMEFYRDCLDGEITIMQTCGEATIDFPEEASEMIFNSEMKAEGVCIKASDNPANHGKEINESNFSLFVHFSEQAEFESVGEKLAEGGSITMQDDGHFLMLQDKFGFSWMLTTA
ncbi:MAG: VOC family protein [Pyrinomonadaceae bacterium]|nr:VOC family protein [Pyrinomonadaceae bacterium]